MPALLGIARTLCRRRLREQGCDRGERGRVRSEGDSDFPPLLRRRHRRARPRLPQLCARSADHPDGPLHSIAIANQFIMRQNRAAIATLSSRTRQLVNISVRGHTDLAIGDRKFSGNSQRRRKHFLLFHGTFLLNFDLALIGELLPMPSKQPDYREDRSHDRFPDQPECARGQSEGRTAARHGRRRYR